MIANHPESQNDLLYQLWQDFCVMCHDENTEAHTDSFIKDLLYYVGFQHNASKLLVIPQLTISNQTGSRRRSADMAVGKASDNSDADDKWKVLTKIDLFIENKAFSWRSKTNKESRACMTRASPKAQLIFGAIEALTARKQFNQYTFLMRNLGGRIRFYKLKVSEEMWEKIAKKEKNCGKVRVYISEKFATVLEVVKTIWLVRSCLIKT